MVAVVIAAPWVTAFDGLSVFGGRFSLADAEAVLGPEAVDALDALRGAALLSVEAVGDAVGYRWLAPIRAVATSRALANGQARRARAALHAHYDAQAAGYLRDVDPERFGIRVAPRIDDGWLDALDCDDPPLAVEVFVVVADAAGLRTPGERVLRIVDRGLARATDPVHVARLLLARAQVKLQQLDDAPGALADVEEAARIPVTAGWLIGSIAALRGFVLIALGRFGEAERALREGLTRAPPVTCAMSAPSASPFAAR